MEEDAKLAIRDGPGTKKVEVLVVMEKLASKEEEGEEVEKG